MNGDDGEITGGCSEWIPIRGGKKSEWMATLVRIVCQSEEEERGKRDGVEGRLKYRIRDEEYWGCVMYS